MLGKEEIEKIFIKSGALMEGHFTLTSGKHSDKYMQCAQVLQYPEFTEVLLKPIAEKFSDDNIELVVGPAMGGIIVAYEAARQLKVPGIFTERENGKMMLRRGFNIKPGQRVLVVEDVITTGGSVKEVIDVVEQAGGVVAGVAILVDRSGGKIDFGVKKEAVLTMEMSTWKAEECPLCKAGRIPAIRPGTQHTV